MIEDKDRSEKLTQYEKDIINESIDKNLEEFIDILEESHITLEKYSSVFSGPLPHPDILKGYKEVDEEIPLKIVKMAEKDYYHQVEMEKTLIEENIKIEKRGMNFAFITALSCLILGVFLIYLGKDIYGLVALLPSIISVINSFLLKNKKDKDNKVKDNNNSK